VAAYAEPHRAIKRLKARIERIAFLQSIRRTLNIKVQVAPSQQMAASRLVTSVASRAPGVCLITATTRSMLERGMPIPNFLTACQQLIVQSVDVSGLIGRDILQMQRSQLILGWLVISTIVNRPWSIVKWRGARCVGRKSSWSTRRNGAHREQRAEENGTS
jgi:hypothetical protein